MFVILGRAAVGLRVPAPVGLCVQRAVSGRFVVIDLRVDRIRGWAVGHLIVRFATSAPGPDYLEIEPIGEVPVLMDRRLLPVLRLGATLGRRSSWFGDRFVLDLDRPADWLDFLDGRLEGAA